MANIPIRNIPLEGTPTGSAYLVFDDGQMKKGKVESLADAVRPVASQGEAEAGVNNTKVMPPVRVKQAIASEVGVTVASKAQGDLANSAVQSVAAGTGVNVDSSAPTAPVVALTSAVQTSLGKADTALQPGSKASKSDAEGGTENTKWMSPLRTHEAIDAYTSSTIGPVGSPPIATYRTFNQRFKDHPSLYDFGCQPFGPDNSQQLADLYAYAEANTDVRTVIIPPGNFVVKAWPGLNPTTLGFRGCGRYNSVFYWDFDLPDDKGLFTYLTPAGGTALEDFGIIKNKENSSGCNIAIHRPGLTTTTGGFSLRNLLLTTANLGVDRQIFVNGTSAPLPYSTPAVRGLGIYDCALFGGKVMSAQFMTVSGLGVYGTSVSAANGNNGNVYLSGDSNWPSYNNDVNLLGCSDLAIDRCTNSVFRVGAIEGLLTFTANAENNLVDAGRVLSNVVFSAGAKHNRANVARLMGNLVDGTNGLNTLTEGRTGSRTGDAANGQLFLPNRRVRKWMQVVMVATNTLETKTWPTGGDYVPFTAAPEILSTQALNATSAAVYASPNVGATTPTTVQISANAVVAVKVIAEGPY